MFDDGGRGGIALPSAAVVEAFLDITGDREVDARIVAPPRRGGTDASRWPT
ncbi:MAG: hypothetical protein R2695_07095 [Acidimicrobiales bacterium]